MLSNCVVRHNFRKTQKSAIILEKNRHDMKLTRPTIESLIIEREDAHQGASLKQFLSIDGQS